MEISHQLLVPQLPSPQGKTILFFWYCCCCLLLIPRVVVEQLAGPPSIYLQKLGFVQLTMQLWIADQM